MSKEQGGVKPQEIRMSDQVFGAEYANALQVGHSREEFQMVFFSIIGQTGRVSAKVISNPGHFKRMITAMVDNLAKYEEQYGPIDEAGKVGESGRSLTDTDKEIGFRG
jgi:hypothetical protein